MQTLSASAPSPLSTVKRSTSLENVRKSMCNVPNPFLVCNQIAFGLSVRGVRCTGCDTMRHSAVSAGGWSHEDGRIVSAIKSLLCSLARLHQPDRIGPSFKIKENPEWPVSCSDAIVNMLHQGEIVRRQSIRLSRTIGSSWELFETA